MSRDPRVQNGLEISYSAGGTRMLPSEALGLSVPLWLFLTPFALFV